MPSVREETVTDVHGPRGLKNFFGELLTERAHRDVGKWRSNMGQIAKYSEGQVQWGAVSQMSVWKEPGWLEGGEQRGCGR